MSKSESTTPQQQLSVKRPLTAKTEKLKCTRLVRDIQDGRQVYEALWDKRDVIVKVFSGRFCAGRRLKREWRGLSILQARGLSAPKPLFTGQTEKARQVIVTEKISPSVTALEAFNNANETAQRLNVLINVTKELARQHTKGIEQKDLHLGNFILSGGKIYAIDAGQMSFSRKPLGRKKSIRQIAILICCLTDPHRMLIEKICTEYAKCRGWHFNKSDKKLFDRQLGIQKSKSIKRALKKSLRTSKRFVRIKKDRIKGVFDREFYDDILSANFLEKIDSLMDNGRIIKAGNTCKVSRTTINGRDIVIKKYNHRGLLHSIRHTIKRSRARRSWLNAHRFIMLKIDVPKPLAYIERLNSILLWSSYLVTEYADGQNLHDFLQDENGDEQRRSVVAEQIAAVLKKMGQNRISHNDLKHSNIIVTPASVVLTDFDGVKNHRFLWTYRLKRRKDISRITKNWPELQTTGTADS